MAESETILFNTKINTGGSAESVKSLKGQLRDLVNELGKLEPGSKAFVTAAKRAGELQDRIEDTKNAVAAFNPEKKFQAFAGVVGGVANGFSALQGATALFGAQNKDIEAAILKTQAAMALATGLNGLLGMKDALGLVATVIKTNVVAAFGTMKAAIISTGIGALVVAIGIAISKIMDYNQAIDDEADFTNKLNDAIEKNTKLMEGVAAASEKARNAKRGGLDELQRELKLLEASGDKEKEVFAKRQEILQAELLNLKTRKYSGLNVTKEIADKENEIKVSQLAFDKKLADEKKLHDKKAAADKKKLDDDAIKEANRIADLKFEHYIKDKDDQEQLSRDFETARQNQVNEDLKFAAFQEEQSAASIALAKAEQEAKLNTYGAIANGLQNLANIAADNTIFYKGISVASAIMDTFAGANKALAQGGAFGFISAAAVIFTGIKNIQSILAVKVPKSSGASISGVSSMSAPALPPSSNVTRLANGNSPLITRTLDVKNNRVYVLETDITRTQKKVKSIEDKATVK